jgi:hypothetical protein
MAKEKEEAVKKLAYRHHLVRSNPSCTPYKRTNTLKKLKDRSRKIKIT